MLVASGVWIFVMFDGSWMAARISDLSEAMRHQIKHRSCREVFERTRRNRDEVRTIL